jgi:pimeloyl-ACP methyl ester carboxylesterase
MTGHTEIDAQSAAPFVAGIAALEAQARRVETPCGAGTMVWRIWGEGEPLVLAHGAQGSWTHWLRAIPALARNRMVIAADLPGHGSSAAPEAETHAAMAEALATGLTAILGERQADLAGFSFGGVMFAYFAALYPQAVRRLILIGTGGLDTPIGDIDLRRIGGLRGEARREALRANLLGLMLHHPASADDLAIHLLITNARAARFTASAQLVVPDRLAKILPQIRAPIDAIWGEHDRPHPDPAAQEAVLRGSQPHLDFRVIADAGHWVMYERPEALIATLTDLLAAPPRATL